MRASKPRHDLARGRAGGASVVVAVVLGVAAGLAAANLPWGSTLIVEAEPEAPQVEAGAVNFDALVAASPESGAGEVRFTVVAAGDVLPHTPVNASAKTGSGYDYTRLMAPVRNFIAGADLALCHMEVPVTPPGQAASGYPRFAAPAPLVRDLAKVGWDGCSTASNHSVDRGYAGVVATLKAFDSVGLGYAGTARTAAEAASTQYYRIVSGTRTVTVADISFAYGTNGLPLPADAPYAVNIFDADAADVTPILDAARAARAEGADVVIASTHCCVEYQTAPTGAQRAIAAAIATSGLVDLYVGHHAHVPQPIEKLPGGPSGDGMWVAFGLGNFLSNQDANCCARETSSGVLLTATFVVTASGSVDVDVEWTATTVDRLSKHTMHALRDIKGGVGTLSAAEVAARLARVAIAVGQEAPERTTPVQPLADATVVLPRAR